MSVYKACDIRGPVQELSPELYARWGQTLGQRLADGETMVVGGDVRLSTPAFKTALIDGLCTAGARVLDLGILPTPMVYFTCRHLCAAGCAIVTASHNPPEINGLKWMINNVPATQDDVQALRAAAEASPRMPTRTPGTVTAYNIAPAYVAWLQTQYASASPTQHVVLDPGNGCWSRRAAVYAAAVFPDLRIETIHDEEDGAFPLRNPDSARPEYLTRLRETVLARGADLGVAFDGDGDRVAFVDDAGYALTAEEATWVLLHSFAETFTGRAFVYDIKFSARMAEGCRALGGNPCMERSGHAFIRRRMLDEQALFGAEISGHYFYGELDGGDDGLYTALRLLGWLSAIRQPLSTLRRACPPITMTPDLRVAADAATQAAVLAHLRAAFPPERQLAIDGVRIAFPDGWALVRSSVTEAALTFRFEATNAVRLDALVREVCRELPNVGERVWQRHGGEKHGETE